MHPVQQLRTELRATRLPSGVSWKRFFKDLGREISDDNIFNGAAALAYYLMLAVFPATLFLLTLIPYLHIPNLDQMILDQMRQSMPDQAANMFRGVIQEVVLNKKGGLLSFGVLGAFWAAANGTYAIMQQLNITYDVKEGRNFLKTRATALALTTALGALIILAFAMILVGGSLESWLSQTLGWQTLAVASIAVLRWGVSLGALLLAFALIYYFGPDVEQKFKFITPGSMLGVLALALGSLGFKLYVSHFSNYQATYGSIGAVIVFMLWLYLSGLVILLGSEVNSLLEHYSPEGKSKGEKQEPDSVNSHSKAAPSVLESDAWSDQSRKRAGQ